MAPGRNKERGYIHFHFVGSISADHVQHCHVSSRVVLDKGVQLEDLLVENDDFSAAGN